MNNYEQARFDFGTATILQDWPAALEALEQMAKNRPTDDVSNYLAEQVKAVRSRMPRTFRWFWQKEAVTR